MFVIPDVVHEIALALTLITLIFLLFKRGQYFLLYAVVGMETILLNLCYANFPKFPSVAEYLSLNVVECVVYAAVGFMASQLRALGSMGISRVYYFLSAYSCMTIAEFYLVNTLSYWATTFVHNAAPVIHLICTAAILIFALFGGISGGKRKRSNLALDSGGNTEHGSFCASKIAKK